MKNEIAGDLPDFWKKPDFTVTGVTMLNNVYLRWQTRNAGFGEVRFYVASDGKIHCENECMDREFVKSVLVKLVDDAVWD